MNYNQIAAKMNNCTCHNATGLRSPEESGRCHDGEEEEATEGVRLSPQLFRLDVRFPPGTSWLSHRPCRGGRRRQVSGD